MIEMSQEQLEARSQEASELLKLMSNRTRLLVLCKLFERELSVSELQSDLGISQSALSQHLSLLREASLVSTRRQGVEIYYTISDERVAILLDALQRAICFESP